MTLSVQLINQSHPIDHFLVELKSVKDAVIVCKDGVRIMTSSLLLSMCSPVINTALNDRLPRTDPIEILMPDFRASVIKGLLSWISQGTFDCNNYEVFKSLQVLLKHLAIQGGELKSKASLFTKCALPVVKLSRLSSSQLASEDICGKIVYGKCISSSATVRQVERDCTASANPSLDSSVNAITVDSSASVSQNAITDDPFDTVDDTLQDDDWDMSDHQLDKDWEEGSEVETEDDVDEEYGDKRVKRAMSFVGGVSEKSYSTKEKADKPVVLSITSDKCKVRSHSMNDFSSAQAKTFVSNSLTDTTNKDVIAVTDSDSEVNLEVSYLPIKDKKLRKKALNNICARRYRNKKKKKLSKIEKEAEILTERNRKLKEKLAEIETEYEATKKLLTDKGMFPKRLEVYTSRDPEPLL